MTRLLVIALGVAGCATSTQKAATTAEPLPAATVASPACHAGEICPHVNSFNEPCTCEACPATALGQYDLPLKGDSGVFCFHGTQGSEGTHAFRNTFFAVDLASPLKGPPSEVVAARGGTVVSLHQGCPDPGLSTGYHDTCGSGFGNWVVLDHGDHEASFYAHLARIVVTEGQIVQQGQELGTEGITGGTGNRHLHFSVHHVAGPTSAMGIWWPAIPYKLTYRKDRGAAPITIEIDTLSCPRNDFEQAPQAWSPK